MSLWQLFVTVAFLTALSFGGGNTLLAGLERELVHTGLVTPEQFAAGVALGHSTPGPLAAFTTALGRYLLGVPGAIAATAGLMVVSLAAVYLIDRIPAAWFRLPPVKSALAAIGPYVGALVCFLAYRVAMAGNSERLAAPLLIGGLVMFGRFGKLPSAVLIAGAVLLGTLLQGTSLAGW
jgi:chromate transporter